MERPGSAPSASAGIRRRSALSDPLVRGVTIAIFIVIILWLAAVLSALVFGVFNRSGAPRTQAERDITYYSQKTAGGKGDSATFAAYADALIRAGQLSKADDVLQQGLKTAKQDKSYLYAEQAQLANAENDYSGAVAAAEKAMAEAQKELAAFEERNVQNNRRKEAGAVMPDSYSTACLAKATALVGLKDYAKAVKAFDAYLKLNGTDADVLAARAEARVQTGDKAGAKKDYQAALKFIPDYQPAIDGLKKIGAAK